MRWSVQQANVARRATCLSFDFIREKVSSVWILNLVLQINLFSPAETCRSNTRTHTREQRAFLKDGF